MSKKLFRTIGTIATVVAGAALIATGVGSALGGTMLFTAFGASIAASTIATVAGAISVGASLLSRPKAPATSTESTDRLSVSMDPRTPRKFVVGRTAMATDIRDQEFSNNQEYLHRFVVTSSHKASAIEEIWFDDKKAWSSSGGVTSDFAGYLTVTPILEGSAANAINLSARMGATRRYTGLSYVYFRFKLTGNSKKAESPFAQSIPTRVTIIGKGAPTYDPRLDSTVAGGSGAHRAADQATWVWNDAASRNPAIQLLWYLLGWRIKNPATNEWRLAVGKGIPASRIDLASFITAANLCDEPVTLAAGGTQPRYRSDGVFSEADATGTVLDQLKAAMNAELDDVDGKIRITVLHNDLATPIADFNDDDILGGFTWDQTAPLDETYNVVRGTFIDPSTTSLYQAVDFPEVRIASLDGIDRIETVDFQTVQDASQAQRLVKQRIARMLYSGRFTATFSYRAWKVQKNDVIRLSFGALGWTNKLFRVIETAVQVDGQVPMVLQVESADIYLWDRDERPAIQPVQPTSYDPYLNPIYQDVVEPKYSDGVPIDELRPAEPGATAGATPEERDLLAELDADIEQAEVDIAAAQATITALENDAAATKAELEGDIADIQAVAQQIQADAAATQADLAAAEATIASQGATISQQGAAITQAKADILANATSIQTVSTTVGNQGTAITTLQQTASGQAGQISTLQQTVATQGGSISTNATAITNLQGSVSTLSQTVSTQGGSITTLQQSVTTVQGSVSTLSQTVSTQGGQISTLQQTVTTQVGTLSTLSQTVTAQGSSITQLQTASSTAAGDIATLKTQISTANSNISTNASAITAANQNIATLTTQVRAGNPNLLPNGSGENGLTGWTGANFSVVRDANGSYFYATTSGTYTLESAKFKIWGNNTYTISASWGFIASGGYVYVDLLFYDANGNGVGDGDQVRQPPGRGAFGSDGADRTAIAIAAQAPSTATQATARFVVDAGTGVTYAAVRQIKVEQGSVATAYSAEASLTQAFTAISTASGSLASLSSTVATQGGSITTLQQSYTGLNGTVSSLSSTVSAQGASITSLQSASTTQAGQIASLQTGLSTANSSISANASAITTANQSIASLQSTVSSQGAAITTAQSAITTLQGSVSTLTTQVSAGNPNLLPNGGFENGGVGWSGGNFSFYSSNPNGAYAVCTTNGTNALSSAKFAVWPNSPYTISAGFGFLGNGGGSVYVDLIFYDANGNSVLDSPQNAVGQNIKGAFVSDGSDRKLIALTVTSPATAATAVARFVVEGATNISYAAVRQIKVEQGSVATAYSAEASVAQSFQTLSTLTTQYASLSTTVSTQGVTITSQQTAITTINNNVTTLFGRAALTVEVGGVITGWETNNNGATGDFKIRADRFQIVTAAGGTKTFEARQGTIIGYYSNGSKMYQLGEQSVA